ncbi:MAG TPA: 3-hydroxybutyrate oligomer hydrolase family protein [Burkholderiales bacterium]|nr:3-hydroxybutyrate oligomer hydrolase family protein [Burkholderiales bacterium]
MCPYHAQAIAAAVLLTFASVLRADDGKAPSFIHGPILKATYDGIGDDLLTAGLGKTGLTLAAPGFAKPLEPTPAELRRLAIYVNYRALVDITSGGGYGVLYGPNVAVDGTVTAAEGKIAGEEYIAFAGDEAGRRNVTMMVQIPSTFNPAQACIVTAPSSGSRGIYGAIATAGEWGLKHGCAVAYTDKGTGTGAHDLQNNTVNLITGVVTPAAAAGDLSIFTARLTADELAAFNAQTPNRFAFKHAHSQLNPEQDWGRNVLQSIEFAFYLLNQKFGEKDKQGKVKEATVTKGNTIVIASSVSNGGGASIRAAERDKGNPNQPLIDGVAVAEPNVNPARVGDFVIRQGAGVPVANHSKSLFDYTTLVNLYQPCASVAQGAAAPLNLSASPNRCQSLRDKGLLKSDTLAGQAAEAQQIINAYGILPEQNFVQPSHAFAFVPNSISLTYANAYGRFSVADHLCGYSFGATSATGNPMALPAAAGAILFSNSNGIPPTSGVNLINNLSVGGPKEDRLSTSPSTARLDQNIDGALCLRSLALGRDAVTGASLSAEMEELAERVQAGVHAVRASGDLDGIPTLIVTGRSDAILPPNHASRAYYGLNQQVEGQRSNVRYVEVKNAQHLDSFNAFPGFNNTMIPLHRYFIQAMDLMYAHLKNGVALPPSQVVRTTPRAGAAPITLANVPPIQAAPAAGDLITFSDGVLRIPD